jgi:hypothetical protein
MEEQAKEGVQLAQSKLNEKGGGEEEGEEEEEEEAKTTQAHPKQAEGGQKRTTGKKEMGNTSTIAQQTQETCGPGLMLENGRQRGEEKKKSMRVQLHETS